MNWPWGAIRPPFCVVYVGNEMGWCALAPISASSHIWGEGVAVTRLIGAKATGALSAGHISSNQQDEAGSSRLRLCFNSE